MLCQKCGTNNANIKIVKNINGNVFETYLCSECAKEDDLTVNINSNFFEPIFSNIFSPTASSNPVCHTCGLSYREFKNSGKFGCSECVDVFAPFLDSLLKNIHGSISHTGKLPKKAAEPINRKRGINELKQKLQKAIENQEFEQAAIFRDEIKKLEAE